MHYTGLAQGLYRLYRGWAHMGYTAIWAIRPRAYMGYMGPGPGLYMGCTGLYMGYIGPVQGLYRPILGLY